MREIKFRGKAAVDVYDGGTIVAEQGAWIHGGAYVHNNGSPYIISHDVGDVNEEYFAPEWWYSVDPNTVGQYTGLNDKNGVEIYEGDIVCNRWGNSYTPIFRNGIYMACSVEISHWKQQEPVTQFNVIWRDGCEIIGNIHDNQELLEAVKQKGGES